MKTLLLSILLISIDISLNAQTNRFHFGIEYSPNFSNVTDLRNDINYGYRISHNIFLKTEYSLTKRFDITAGFGYLNTREFSSLSFGGQLDIERVDVIYNTNYLALPLGLKYNFGSFYIQPEVAIAYNFDNTDLQRSYASSGATGKTRWKDDINTRYNHQFTAPCFLTLGHKIDLKYGSILFGVKGYYSLNKIGSDYGIRGKHYYGFGVMTGLRF